MYTYHPSIMEGGGRPGGGFWMPIYLQVQWQACVKEIRWRAMLQNVLPLASVLTHKYMYICAPYTTHTHTHKGNMKI